ncbi:hypothetical protein BDR03DRAFT_1006071 [Suillus americanus]|nr:hypothetical protein BDR03DRAFT_1006071 [Suillus americanus]
MACIALDPALDIQPDFSTPIFKGLRDQIIGGTQMTHEDVAADLTTAWQQDHDLRVLAWTRQSDEDTRLAAEVAKANQEQADQERLQLEHEAEVELRKAEKKKPKINDFKTGMVIGDTLTPRPSQYAIHKLKTFEYVELWYFSPDGCKTMAEDAKTNADDAFGLTKVDDFVALKPVTSFKASRKAIQDHTLEWRQFDLAKNSFLLYINKLNWPDKHQRALTMFFMNIQVLLLYAARVRRDWHDTLALNNAFDISAFNLALLKSMNEEVWNKACYESLTEYHESHFISTPATTSNYATSLASASTSRAAATIASSIASTTTTTSPTLLSSSVLPVLPPLLPTILCSLQTITFPSIPASTSIPDPMPS